MLAKNNLHRRALILRRKGYSYAEIARIIKTSKSTLSVWLRGLDLSDEVRFRLSEKKRKGQIKGALAKSNLRKRRTKEIISNASLDIKNISKRELWLLGISIYWCEGTKQKQNNVSQPVVFANADPYLIRLFVSWLKISCLIREEDIIYSLYIHENGEIKNALIYWREILGLTEANLNKVILKKHKSSTNRKYQNLEYYGLIRVSVRRSTELNRRITGWIFGINNNL